MYHSRLCIGVSGTASPPPGKFNVATPLKYLHQNSRDITRSNCTPRSLLHLLTHVETLIKHVERFVGLSPCFTLRPTDITNI